MLGRGTDIDSRSVMENEWRDESHWILAVALGYEVKDIANLLSLVLCKSP